MIHYTYTGTQFVPQEPKFESEEYNEARAEQQRELAQYPKQPLAAAPECKQYFKEGQTVREDEIEVGYEILYILSGNERWADVGKESYERDHADYKHKRILAYRKSTEPLIPNLAASTANLSKIKDKDKWLDEVRGGEQPGSGEESGLRIIDRTKLFRLEYEFDIEDQQGNHVGEIWEPVKGGGFTVRMFSHKKFSTSDEAIQYAKDTLSPTLSASTAGRENAMRVLESLTPGGSEFVNDPNRCAEFIKEQLAAMKSTILSLKHPTGPVQEDSRAGTIREKYKLWCKETKRNGSALVGGSIYEFFDYLENNLQPPAQSLEEATNDDELISKVTAYMDGDLQPSEQRENAKECIKIILQHHHSLLVKEVEKYKKECSRLQSQLTTLQQEREQLQAWKKEAISVMPDYQSIGKAIGVSLGQSVHDKILPWIEKAKQEIEQFKKEGGKG